MSWQVSAIVLDDASGSILLEKAIAGDGAAGRLPAVDLPSGEPDGERLVAAVSELLGRPVLPIWLRSAASDDATQSGKAFVLTVGERGHDASGGRAWARAAAVIDVLEPVEARAPVRAWLDRLAGHSDPRTPSWMEPGWFDRVSAWMATHLTQAGMPPTESASLVYQSPIGTVIRARSGDREAYLKCSAPHFRREASITRTLARRTPASVPEVIAIDDAEGWLLMAGFGDRILGRGPEADWVDGLRCLAEIQRDWVTHADELVAGGAQHRPLHEIAEALPHLLEVDGLADRIGAPLLERWPDLLARFTAVCHELEDVGLPEALVHGDPHPWNIAVTDRGLVVFDWSDGAAGPSFVDIAVFLRRTKDLALRRRLRDAYVDAWSGAAPRQRLVRACDLAMAVGGLYQVITYQALLPALPPEDRVVYAGSDRGWFRAAVDGLERGLDAVGLPA